MGRRRQDYYVRIAGYRNDGKPFFDLTINGRKTRLAATNIEDAEAEALGRYEQSKATVVASARASVKPKPGTLREGMALYMRSGKWHTYKPLTHRQARSSINLILATKTPSGKMYGEIDLNDWLFGIEAPDSVKRIMALCGPKYGAANHRLKALNGFFTWLLGDMDGDAADARLQLRIDRHARNPCLGIAPRKGGRGYTPIEREQVDDWLLNAKDDPEEHRAIRLLLMVGGRTSDLHRLNRGMIRETPAGRVLTFTCEKGKGSNYRKSRTDSVARVPMVPELEALIAELPADRFCFIHSEHDRPYSCAESLGNRIRDWRREAGLPEGLSAHSWRKAATHWWLRNHRDLIANNFSLKTIFGWMTDKEVENYTRDFDRDEEARGMLIRLADRRKARQ